MDVKVGVNMGATMDVKYDAKVDATKFYAKVDVIQDTKPNANLDTKRD